MELYGRKDKSILQKIIVLILEIIILGISYWILFEEGYNVIFPQVQVHEVNEIRRIIIFIFNCIVFFRILFTIFYLMKRKMPWEEAFSIPFAFAVYYIGFALLGYRSAGNFNILDLIGIILFLTGSFLNTFSELQRDRWKKESINKGHLYSSGLFKYSMHINYFGDFLWVSGYAFVTHNLYSIVIPVFIFCFFAFYNIPKLDSYLSSKYGDEFIKFKKSTKKFIPFIY
jgi:protein-S-isoprenylcysteine O-methyltransferase Ste14